MPHPVSPRTVLRHGAAAEAAALASGLAPLLASPQSRWFASFGKGELDMGRTGEIDYLVGVLRDVAPAAERAGVTIGLESYLSAADCPLPV